MCYRYQITKFEREYFKVFGYYPPYFVINSRALGRDYYRLQDKILNYEVKISYDKDETCNLISEIDCRDCKESMECCTPLCDVCPAICCISCCVICKQKSRISNIFNHRHVMSTNFKNRDVFILVGKYKIILDNLISETKEKEWQMNEINNGLENRDDNIDIINKDKKELESKLESEPLNVLRDLANVYKKEKMNKQLAVDMENKIKELNETIIANRLEIYICREKINELYKYAAMCNLVE
jgi:hypothetical protein